MKTCCLMVWRKVAFLFALVAINVDICSQTPTSTLGQKDIDQSLKFLKESLRWVRSPTPGTRFRPWGGKRDILLCLSPTQLFSLRFHSKCQRFSGKKDLRTFSGNDASEQIIPRSEDFDLYLTDRAALPSFDKGMPETTNDEQSLENGSSSSSWAMSSPGYLMKKNLPLETSVEENSNEKKHAFYPWAGKRDHKFYPWAGKRNIMSTFYKDVKNNPVNYNNTNKNGARLKEELTNELYDSENHRREKRKVLEVAKFNDSTDARLSKRSTIQFWKESTKRIGILSDLIKEFNNIKGGLSQRGFHPWAGKKRSEVELYGPTISYDGMQYSNPFSTNLIRHDHESGNLYINRGTMDSLLNEKRHTFYPWAGKRNVDNMVGTLDEM